MPHKHKRKRGDPEDYDLPPSQKAKPLPAQARAREDHTKTKRERSRQLCVEDKDAPRAFRRLMAAARGRKVRSGLDDTGTRKVDGAQEFAARDQLHQAPKIRPGENLRSFGVRVDAALPVAGLTKKTVVKDGKDEQGIKVYRTRKERKLHKLYDQWHAEERKMQAKKEEEAEMMAERELNDDAENITSRSFTSLDDAAIAGSKKRRKRGAGSRLSAVDDDPWLQLKKTRAETKVRLHDLAQAPPTLNKRPNTAQRTTVNDAAVEVGTIPKLAGSLRHREELHKARGEVLEAYRKIREHEQAKLKATGS